MKGRRMAEFGLTGFFLLALMLWTDTARRGVLQGLAVSCQVLIPSLFPFSAGAGTLIRMGFADRLSPRTDRLMRRLFHLPGQASVPLLLGLLGGYPLGAQSLAALYREKALSRAEAIRLSRFCNNAGPAFLIGAVGGGIFHSVRTGILLLLIHWAAALLTGGLLAGGQTPASDTACGRPGQRLNLAQALPGAVAEAASSMVRITGMVVFFSVGMELLGQVLPLAQLPQPVLCLVHGWIELSGGTARLAGMNPAFGIPAAAFLVSWGGLCVHMQAAERLLSVGLPEGPYLVGKALQALLSLPPALAFARPKGTPGAPGAALFACGVGVVLLLLLLLFRILQKKRWKKGQSVL